jgi:hypothetical protein
LQYLTTPLLSVIDITVALHVMLLLHHRLIEAFRRYDSTVQFMAVVGLSSVSDTTVTKAAAGGDGVVVSGVDDVVAVGEKIVEASADVMAILSVVVCGAIVDVVLKRKTSVPGYDTVVLLTLVVVLVRVVTTVVVVGVADDDDNDVLFATVVFVNAVLLEEDDCTPHATTPH